MPRFNDAEYHELPPFTGHVYNDTELFAYQLRPGSSHSLGGQQDPVGGRDKMSAVSPSGETLPQPLGMPTVKKTFHVLHVLAAGLSLICLALGVAAVASESLSWRLGVSNYQLIVVGFLLSIMNLCLTSVTPGLFLLLEARLGSSTLQNYQGILRNQVLSSRLGFAWRLVLSVMLALPLGLSVAYKTFAGGESAISVSASTYIGKASYYGMYALPGLQHLGERTGISLFSNATLPFAVGSSSQTGPEPPFPISPRPYGFNVLSLNNRTTAMLDIPEPSYISAVQLLLAGGESWNITAQVYGTVATFNNSRTEDLRRFQSDFDSFCEQAQGSSGAFSHVSMLNYHSVNLVSHPSPGDQSLQYIALSPDPGVEHLPTCSNLSNYVQPYDISRQGCNGTWSITRGGFQLVAGSCDSIPLVPDKQRIIYNSTAFMGVWYMPSLVELIGPFATSRNGSAWESPSMATAIAAMLWSRLTALNSVVRLAEQADTSRDYGDLSPDQAGVSYSVNDEVVYIRPTLRKSGLLYWILLIQPLLIIVVLGLTATFHTTPIDKEFGLISILAGIDRGSVDVLSGATLSGQLARDIKLVMQPRQTDGGKAAIGYHCQELLPTDKHIRNGRLNPRTVYH